MPVHTILSLGTMLAAAAVLAGPPSESANRVHVANFPETQRVEGTVTVEGHLDAARLVKFEKVILPPAPPDNPARMVDLGLLDAAGFRSVMLSLAGSFPGSEVQGKVGVLLVPEAEFFQEALIERGHAFLALRAEATLDPTLAPDFVAGSTGYPLAFARYRIFLYNTSLKTLEANVYLNLTD